MQSNIVVTSGKYLDIDAYASCIAYKELLNSLGISAFAVSTAQTNMSVPNLIKQIPISFDDYIPTRSDKFIILDLSDPVFFDKLVRYEDVIEVIDHHTGLEEFWQTKPNVKTQIERIGSVATIVYEKFVVENRTDVLTPDLCKLLVAAIVDNTLNLMAKITTNRDKAAYNALYKIANLSSDWTNVYLEQCEKAILENLESSVKQDTKTLSFKNLPKQLAQLAIYNHEKVLSQLPLIKQLFQDSDDWALNIISLKEGTSHIITNRLTSKDKLTKLFAREFKGDVLLLDSFMLRKEIMAKAQCDSCTEEICTSSLQR